MTLLRSWKLHISVAALAVGITAYFVFPILLYVIYFLFTFGLCVLLAVLRPPGAYVRRGKRTYPELPFPTIEGPLSKIKPYPPPSTRPVLLSPNVDAHLQKVLDLTLEHHVIPTYETIGQDQEAFFNSVMPEIWNVLAALQKRMSKMDTMKLITQDVVESLRSHFEHYRGLHYRDPQADNMFPNLIAFPYLVSPEHELNFLRQVCEVLLCVLLPRHLLECTSVRVLIREYLTCRILNPTIEMVCDPDYINQKLSAYLTKREEAVNSAQKRYSYSKTYEDFVKHIKKCEDLLELQEIRQMIITDIIQAKAVQKMKTSRMTGIHGGQFPIPIPAEKVKILMGRDLELYITQLGTTKAVTERQIRKLGGEDYQEETATDPVESHPSDTPLGIPFETIMHNETARTHLLIFLEQCGFASSLHCWMSINMLPTTKPTLLHKNIKSLYDEYLSPTAPSPIHADPSLVSAVNSYLTEDSTSTETCMSSLTEIQECIYDEIYEQFYHNFIASEQYRELMAQAAEGGERDYPSMKFSESMAGSGSAYYDPSMEDSRYKQKLKSLRMKLEEKDDELSLMPEEVRSSQSLSQRKKALQKDRLYLEDEIKKLEHYIEHTEEWFGTLGQWTIDIQTVDLKEDIHNPLFIIVVHRPEAGHRRDHASFESLSDLTATTYLQTAAVDSESGTESFSELSEDDDRSSRAGWVLGRNLLEFEELHKKVVEICPNLQFPPLPRILSLFQRPSKTYWEKYRTALQGYLCSVLRDERLQESEEVFNFLSPASDNLHKAQSVPQEKKPQSHRFSLPVPKFGSKDQHHEDGGREDSVAEYMYLLISEVFELDQWSRVLRKQIVELVQLTYGKSIDRELQESMNWVVSEPMLIFYLETFQGAMWPNGEPAPPAPTRSDEEKAATKEKARAQFLKSVPQALQTILGQRNCQIGFQKIFESFQDPRGNRQLFYSLLEVLLYALIPELAKVEIDSENGTDWKAT